MKIGIVGHGSIGQRHAANARELGHDVKVYDPIIIGKPDFRFEHQLYDWCDAAVIATPSPFHESGVRAAVERGKHVMVEKPISIAVGALPAILESAANKNLIVMMGNNLRLHPCVQQAKEWIVAGHIGNPLWASFICATRTAKPPYVSDGVILNTGSHEVDLALHLLGPAKAISANVCMNLGEMTDIIADFVLEHDSGARSRFHLDFITPNEIREFWIAGEERNIGVDLPKRLLSLGTTSNHMPGDYDKDYRAEMEAFIDRIDGKITPGASARDGLATLRVLLDVRKMAGLDQTYEHREIKGWGGQ